MRKNKIKKIITISAVVLLLIATLGTFAAFFGKNDFSKVKDKWNDIKDKFQQEEVVENVNIVKNSNFKINTLSESKSFDKTNLTLNKDFIDNWSFFAGSEEFEAEITLVDNGIHLKNTGNTLCEILYTVEDGVVNYEGDKMTFAVSVDDIVYSLSFDAVFGEVNGLEIYKDSTVSVGIFPGSGQFRISVRFLTGADLTVNWVQLEEGNVFTGYVAPVVA